MRGSGEPGGMVDDEALLSGESLVDLLGALLSPMISVSNALGAYVFRSATIVYDLRDSGSGPE